MRIPPPFQKRKKLKGIKKYELTQLIWAMPESKQSEPWEIYKMIKKELEELEKKEKAQFDGDLKAVRWAQFMCFLVAGWIAWAIVWGGK